MSIGGTVGDISDHVLAEVLINRGWNSILDGQAWEWGGSGNTDGVFAPGACILVDDEHRGYVVEGPALRDGPAAVLRYRSRRELLDRLPSIETWTLPSTAVDLDAQHAEAS